MSIYKYFYIYIYIYIYIHVAHSKLERPISTISFLKLLFIDHFSTDFHHSKFKQMRKV